MYRLMGLAHAGLYRTYRALAAERGQGTVEYVALVLLVAGIFTAVVAATKNNHDSGKILSKITEKLQTSIQNLK